MLFLLMHIHYNLYVCIALCHTANVFEIFPYDVISETLKPVEELPLRTCSRQIWLKNSALILAHIIIAKGNRIRIAQKGHQSLKTDVIIFLLAP